MSELKAISCGEIYNIIEYEGSCITDDIYYQKSEVDKVIADLKKACNDKDDWCLRTLKELRNQKYKRCMNNAWWCLREEFFAEDCHCEHWVDWAIKWYKRWLAIAEKFKEAK